MDFAYNLTNNSFKEEIYNISGRYTYHIPKGVTTVFILAVGAGGGGGGGFTRTAGNAGGGGGGGATGAVSRVIVPKVFLTDSLTVQVGSGGKGGAAGSAGGNGDASTVWFNNLLNPVTNPDTLSGNTILITASGGTAGGGGTSLVGGTAGSGGGSSTATSMKIVSLGEFTNRIGINGDVGGFPTTSNLLYGGGSIPFSSGRGGGGINAATPGTAQDGSGITGRGFVPDFSGGIGGTGGNPGGNGINGMFMMKPFVSLGGCGGGSSNEKSGGNGGNGASGTGGGGGGAGTSPGGLGGSGGKGGDGLVIICCW
jgi:hypothetical protein